MRQEKRKSERLRELSNNVSSRKASKIMEPDDFKKRSIRLDSNFNIMNLNREKEEKLNSANVINIKGINSISISPISPNNDYSLNLENTNTNSVTTSKVISSTPNSSQSNINVMCRFRPLNEKEKLQSKEICVDFVDNQEIKIKSLAENNQYKFSFDRIFDTNTTQQEIYEEAAKPIVQSVLEGFNGTIFAYGQTASGKTYTMQGVFDNPEKEGIIPRMIKDVFTHILHSSDNLEFIVKVSMIEIYMEKIRDLLDTNRINLNIREDKVKGIYIEDLSEHYVSNDLEVLEMMKTGSDNRAMAATNMNEQSSRSHSIFIMTIHQNNVKDLVAKTGKLCLVDLAGSEKISKTGATGLTLEEAKTINKSLASLGMVINNLTDGKSQHIPYRDSKLTRVLQESLGGNAKTCLVVACSPSTYNEAETVSTLRFGLRAKKIKNKPKINKEVTVAELKIEIDKLERFLVTCRKRIDQLENFILFNNLTIPAEGDYSYNDKKENISIIDDDMTTDQNEEVNHNLNEHEIVTYSENNLEENFEDNLENNTLNINEFNNETNKEKQDEISSKYSDVINQLNLLEDDKKNLNYELDDAISKIKEFSVNIEQKERLIDEFEIIKRNFEIKEQELYEKIQDLQDKLNEEKIDNKSKNAPEFGFNIQDYTNNENQNLSLSLNEDENENIEFIKKEQNEVNPNNEIVDDIYTKVQDIVNNFTLNTDKENNSNINLNSQLNGLVNMIKNKLNNNLTSNDNNSTIEKNMDFEIIKISNTPISLNLNFTNNISNNNSTTTDDIMKKEKKKFENEKKLILKALEEKTDKINQLEIDNREIKDRMKLLESKLNPDDKNYLKKIVSLEKNLEQVNLMYHQVVTQKSVLKIENQVLEKKIKKRNEKITVIEKEISDLRSQLRMANDRLTIYQKNYANKLGNISNNVVRVIKGGHAGSLINGEVLSTIPEIHDNI